MADEDVVGGGDVDTEENPVVGGGDVDTDEEEVEEDEVDGEEEVG